MDFLDSKHNIPAPPPAPRPLEYWAELIISLHHKYKYMYKHTKTSYILKDYNSPKLS